MSAATAESNSAVDPVFMTMRGVTSRRPSIDAAVYRTENVTRHSSAEFGIFLGICFKGSNVVRSKPRKDQHAVLKW